MLVIPWEPDKAISKMRKNYKGFHMPLEACVYRKNGMVHLPFGLATR